jgi:hypothetical protein
LADIEKPEIDLYQFLAGFLLVVFLRGSIIGQKLSTHPLQKEGTMEETNLGGVNMSDEEPLEFEIEVIAKDTAEDDLSKMTYNLLKEIRDYTAAYPTMKSIGPAPAGSKGDSLAMLTMTALPLVLPGAIDIIKSWAMRGQGRTVKFKGKGIEFEGSPEELQKLLASLEKGKKKK